MFKTTLNKAPTSASEQNRAKTTKINEYQVCSNSKKENAKKVRAAETCKECLLQILAYARALELQASGAPLRKRACIARFLWGPKWAKGYWPV